MRSLNAVIWDFDGTLVDTRAKNLAVTRTLVARLTGRLATEIPALSSMVAYEAALHRHQHWHDFYRCELGLDEEQLLAAASLWMEAQAADQTAAPAFDGVVEVLDELGHVPHGIVSLNAGGNISRIIGELGIGSRFGEVLGFEAVPLERRKPQPDALLLCIERLEARVPGTVIYVGDHETDTLCALRAHESLDADGEPVRVVSVAATFGTSTDIGSWSRRPDYVARTARELLAIADDVAG
jgi:phosphoglycolate phosphatase-like HAD superfamily hydrolase